MVNNEEPTGRVREELDQMLRQHEGQLGLVYGLWSKGVRKNADFVEKGAAANSGAAGNSRATIEAIMKGVIPTGPTVAVIARGAVSGLIRRNSQISKATKQYLEGLLQRLLERADDRESRDVEEKDFAEDSDRIQKELGRRSGVYVYTFPMCLRDVRMTNPDRWLFKIGKSDGATLRRVLNQSTGMPEAPVLLRVFLHKTLPPIEVEKKFRKALLAAGHESVRTLDKKLATKRGAKEWFATRLEFLDQIAELLGCEKLSARIGADSRS
jgi:hypothetical protein